MVYATLSKPFRISNVQVVQGQSHNTHDYQNPSADNSLSGIILSFLLSCMVIEKTNEAKAKNSLYNIQF